jgi:Tat protein translocase TatB subunit
VFDIGLPELLVILALALLVVGPEELPSVALRVGRLLYQFRRQYEEITSQFRSEIELIEHEVEAAAGLVPVIGGQLAAPELRISTLGALAGQLPPLSAELSLQVGLLGAVCGRPLSETAVQRLWREPQVYPEGGLPVSWELAVRGSPVLSRPDVRRAQAAGVAPVRG